jgi:hypothetical protein
MKILHICPTFESKTCGIGAYTRNLCAAIKEEFPDVQQSVLLNFSSVHHSLLDEKADVVHIQLEYGFCSHQRLMLIDEYCKRLTIPLFVTFHTIGNAPHNNAFSWGTKLSHTPLSKDYGCFTLIPSGVPRIEACTSAELFLKLSEKEKEEFKTASYLFFGQAHPHKQLLETLLLFKEKTEKRLVCVCSKPIQGGAEYWEECKKLADTLPNVCWMDTYLDDREVLAVSTFCHAALFPYTEYGSIGVSAAVKLLLNNLDLNIFTTFASHFSDISDYQFVVNKFRKLEDMLSSRESHNKEARKVFVIGNTFKESARIHLRLYQGVGF